MKIDGKKLNEDTYIIAEIGNNHNGVIDNAIKMIDLAVEMGADCVKFQMRNLEEVYKKSSLNGNSDDLGTEYILDLLKRFELSEKEHKVLFDYCVKNNITYMCTPWDEKSANILEKFRVSCYKISSADLTNIPLIKILIKTKKPLILSTGMSSLKEIEFTSKFLKEHNTEFALLHCNSTYPAPFHDINLRWMKNLKKHTPWVGYSGHERGINVSLAAVALGAKIIERHFTLDRNMEGPDHAASLIFEDFKALIKGIKEINTSLGNGEKKLVSQGEMINKENLRKSLIASKDIKVGTKIKASHIEIKSPGQGLSPQSYDKLIGVKINRNLKKEEYFHQSDINGKYILPRDYSFTKKWGVPVRFHDFQKFKNICKPNLWEFHLSYSDMLLDPKKFLKIDHNSDFVVHAPELFSNSQLMDLASSNDKIRENSIIQTQEVIKITKNLKRYFPKTKVPLIICNVGGFSMDKPLTTGQISNAYKIFKKSLEELDSTGVEIVPQTMAPFPWHFGGQRFQNLFIKADDIKKYCKLFDIRICFDVSHSFLASNYFKFDFYEFCDVVAPYTAHLHIGDAINLNGEGLQIGEGRIDFKRLGKILKSGCPEASFIPEIWQGHKNNGEGFWIALDKLDNII